MGTLSINSVREMLHKWLAPAATLALAITEARDRTAIGEIQRHVERIECAIGAIT
jgi:hypothetical protein